MKDLAKINRLYLEFGSEKAAICRIGIQESTINKRLSEYKKRPKYQAFNEYRKLVLKITNKQNLKTLENIEKRGFFNYHLDHVISIWTEYKKGIEPETIGHISNLKMIPYKENLRKGKHERK